MKKKHYIIPQIFNYFFAAISVYFFACLYQAQVISTDMIIIGGTITDADGKVTRPMNSYENVKVSRGERVTLAFRIPARSVSGWNHIERHLIDATNAEHIVSTMNRRWTANSPFVVRGDFPIPLHVAPGCDAVIFSKSYYSINWNLLTWIVPMVGISPRVTLCID